jgi:hypothetical protein
MEKAEPRGETTYDLMWMEDAFRLVTDFLLGRIRGTITVLAAPYAYQVTIRRKSAHRRRSLPPR